MKPVSAEDIPFRETKAEPVTEHVFRERGEGWYSLELLPAGIVFQVDRLRRERHELHGELLVTVNGSTPNARILDGGVLTRGDLNLSSVTAIGTRAKLLIERSRTDALDWHGFLAGFAHKVLDAERKGKPAVVLADVVEDDESNDSWDVAGWPLLQDLPMVIFGSGASGKSYLAMWAAGMLAGQGINVLYADWEFSQRDHRKRLGKLFTVMPRNLYYAACDKPMVDEVERFLRLIREHKIRYIVCDSMVFALNGPADDEHAGHYFRAVRELKIGSLHVAHTTKADDDSEKKVYGSVFFTNGARSVWFIQRSENNPHGELQVGLYHRKLNVGELLKPKGFKFVFRSGRTLIEKIAVEGVEELEAKLPTVDRMLRALKGGALTAKALAEDLDCSHGTIRSVLSRNKTKFIKLGNKIGLRADGIDF